MALGEILREARTRKGWSVAQVADATRMMVQIVEELEREDFRRIAAPIYGRGFIKLYAEHVGLDPEPLIQEFIEIYTGARAPVVARRSVATPEPAAPAAPVVDKTAAPAAVSAAVPPPTAAPVETPPPARVQPHPVVPVESPAPAAGDDDLFTAAARPATPAAPAAAQDSPPRVSPVAVRSVRRPMPAKPALPPPAAAAPAAPRRSPGTTATIVAGLRRLWGDFKWPSGWITRKQWIMLIVALVAAGILGYGVRQLLKTTARNASRNTEPFSRPVLPPPDPYVD